MPQSLTAVSLFLASPSDVSVERGIVTEVVGEWNGRHSRHSGVTFQLLKWESSVTAGFGQDGQDVINAQINDDYDVLLALFWTKLGSDTLRAPSGTVEEYRRAWDRFKRGEDVELAFFFKEALIDPREVDLTQLSLLQDFQKEVQGNGALTRAFRDSDGLKLEVSMLLDRLARKYSVSKDTALTPFKADHKDVDIRRKSMDLPDDDDVGLFDIIDRLNTHTTAGGAFLTKLTYNLNEMTAVTNSVTKTFEETKAIRPLEHSELKPGLTRIGDSMDTFSEFAEADLPDYAENLTALTTDVRDMIRVSYDWIDTDENMLASLWPFREMLSGFRNGMSESQRSTSGMASIVNGLPRAMTSFNKSKRRLGHNIDNLIKINENGKLLIEQAINELGMLILAVESKSPQALQ